MAMLVKFVSEGAAVDYKPAADVAAGDVVVQSDLIGIARTAIPANMLGSLAVSGIFDFPKSTAAVSAISAGALVYWDAVAKVATKTATGNKQIGKAVTATVDADAVVRVRVSQ